MFGQEIQFVELLYSLILIQDSHYDFFTKVRWKSGNTKVDFSAFYFSGKTTVLRFTFLV